MKILFCAFLVSLSQFVYAEELPAKAQYRASVNFFKCTASGDPCQYILRVPEQTINRPLSQGTGDFPFDYNGFDGPTLNSEGNIHADVTTYVAYDVNGKKYEVTAKLEIRDYYYSAPFQKYNLGPIKIPTMSVLNETTLSTHFEFNGARYKVEINLRPL